MNDTTRDEVRELRKQIEHIIFDKKHHGNYMQAMRQTANEIIEAVTAVRDAEIRDALLGDGAQEAFWDAFEDAAESAGADPHWLGHVAIGEGLEPGMKAALDHIGLHGDGTGGQG